MRFFLDNDVDASVGKMLRRMGHGCWTAADAGLSGEEDDELTVYACDRDAVLISHDKEFAARRRRNTIGRHLHLRCNEWEAAALLQRRLSEVLPELEAHADILITLSANGAVAHIAWD